MLTRIKNSNKAKIVQLRVINTNIALRILKILKEQGFIDSFQLGSAGSKDILVNLKYKGIRQLPYISNLLRISKPGFRVYVNKNRIPRVFGGLGIAI